MNPVYSIVLGVSASAITATANLPEWADIGILGGSVMAQVLSASKGLPSPSQAIIEEVETSNTPPPGLTFFNWDDLANFDKIPHILIAGGTGDGKSYLCKKLMASTPGRKLALDIHAGPNSWPEGVKVTGKGRNYRAVGDAIIALCSEMDKRYSQLALGVETWEPVSVAIDEFPGTIAALKDEDKDFAGEVLSAFKMLVRESRKVRIRLLILTQGVEVKALGLEGEGSVRDSLRWIRLGNFARKYAKDTKDDRLIDWVSKQQYPSLFEDSPITVN